MLRLAATSTVAGACARVARVPASVCVRHAHTKDGMMIPEGPRDAAPHPKHWTRESVYSFCPDDVQVTRIASAAYVAMLRAELLHISKVALPEARSFLASLEVPDERDEAYQLAHDRVAFLEYQKKAIRRRIDLTDVRSVQQGDQQADGTARVASVVQVMQYPSQNVSEWQLVGAAEADETLGMLSVESPLGEALLGRRPSDEIIPVGHDRYRLISVRYQVAPADNTAMGAEFNPQPGAGEWIGSLDNLPTWSSAQDPLLRRRNAAAANRAGAADASAAAAGETAPKPPGKKRGRKPGSKNKVKKP